MNTKVSDLKSQDIENLRYLIYSAWNSAGAMAHHKGVIEQMGIYPSAVKALNQAKEELKATWLAIEATGIMPALFKEAAAEQLTPSPHFQKAGGVK
jgi:hypothetical protein